MKFGLRRNISKKSYLLLTIVGICAILLAVLSYQYSLNSANQILNLSSEDIRSNNMIQAHDLALILTNGLNSITTNLEILSTSHGVMNQDKDATTILDAVQKSTNELPDYYLWLDQNGKLMWISGGLNNANMIVNGLLTNGNAYNPNFQKGHLHQQNLDLSSFKYFTAPKGTFKPFYGYHVGKSNSNSKISHSQTGLNTTATNNAVVTSYISYPILGKHNDSETATDTTVPNLYIDKVQKNKSLVTTNSNPIFKGVIVAVVRLDLASNLLKKIQLEKNLILLTDNNGIILSSNHNQLIGKSIFNYSNLGDDSIFPQLTSTKMQSVSNFMQRALDSTYPTSSDFPEPNGMIKSSMVSEPVITHGIHLWNLISIAPHTLSHDVNILFEQQNYFSSIMIIIVGIVSLAIVLLIMLWNKELESTVKARTMELNKTNNYLVAANEQLKINDKLHNEFINIASHEMKTPTQSILLHSSLLSQSYYDDDNNDNGNNIYDNYQARRETIDTIFRNAIRLQRLTNDILDVTRISTQSLKLNKEKFNLNNVISQLVDEFGDQIDNGKVTLVFNPSGEKKDSGGIEKNMKKTEDQLRSDIFVVSDKSRIIQVISNLLSNAIKFTAEGYIEISIKREQAFYIHHSIGTNMSGSCTPIQHEQRQDISSTSSFAIVSVKDSGCGLDLDLVPRLFTKFATNSDQGVGLGLYISKNIIEAHGGKIWAENNKDHRGSTFSFTLPLY